MIGKSVWFSWILWLTFSLAVFSQEPLEAKKGLDQDLPQKSKNVLKSGSAWTRDSICTYSYFANGDSALTYRYIYAYDNNTLSQTTVEYFNTSTGKKSSAYQYNYFRTKWGALSQQIIKRWTPTNPLWTPYQRDEYEYDNNRKTSLITKYRWNNASQYYQVYYKYDQYTYDERGRQASYKRFSWDKNHETWQSNYFLEDSWSDHYLERLEKKWDASSQSWTPYRKQTYQYNNSWKLEDYSRLAWNNVDNSWENDYRNLYYYDDFGNNTLVEQYKWDVDTEDWILIKKQFQHFSGLGTGIEKQEKHELTCFPNPVKDYLTIRGDFEGNGMIQIYSAMGQVVLQEQWNGSESPIDLSSLTSGTYVVILETANQRFVKRIVKM